MRVTHDISIPTQWLHASHSHASSWIVYINAIGLWSLLFSNHLSWLLRSMSFLFHFRNSSCGSCSGRLQWGEEGTISSPNYPNPYTGNLDCMWLLRAADEDAKIELECSDIQLQSCGSQNGISPGWKDYLIISPTPNFMMSFVYCGYSTLMGPIKHSSSSDQVPYGIQKYLDFDKKMNFFCRWQWYFAVAKLQKETKDLNVTTKLCDLIKRLSICPFDLQLFFIISFLALACSISLLWISIRNIVHSLLNISIFMLVTTISELVTTNLKMLFLFSNYPFMF